MAAEPVIGEIDALSLSFPIAHRPRAPKVRHLTGTLADLFGT
jgi:hypothetical protein